MSLFYYKEMASLIEPGALLSVFRFETLLPM
jgi:hypothetical protein